MTPRYKLVALALLFTGVFLSFPAVAFPTSLIPDASFTTLQGSVWSAHPSSCTLRAPTEDHRLMRFAVQARRGFKFGCRGDIQSLNAYYSTGIKYHVDM